MWIARTLSTTTSDGEPVTSALRRRPCRGLPAARQGLAPRRIVEHAGARLPVDVADFTVAQFERVLSRHGVDGSLRLFRLSERDLHPDVFERVRQLAEQAGDALQALGQELVHAILHRAGVAHVVDIDFGPDLTDALNAPLALFKPGGVPGKVQVDERAEALQVQSFRGRVSAQEQPDFAPGARRL